MIEQEIAQRKKGKRRRRVKLILVAVPLIFSLAVLLLGSVLLKHFEREAPLELFHVSACNAPPTFYTYAFTDRTARQGECELLTVGAFPPSKGSYTAFAELPSSLTNALVAIEDKRFYRHHGVDWYRTVAAGVTYAFGFSDSFGASTITQQTVKNVTGKDQVTLKRKLQEILYALDLERHYAKEEILELYVNVISFSDACIGVGEAAQHYFSKSPSELTAAESATIAAITNNPSYYNPIRHPENNLRRRDLILREMHEQGDLTEEAYHAAVATPLELRVSEGSGSGEPIRSWYVDMVLEDVISDLCATYGMSRSSASLRVHSGGLRIDIAMDPRVQSMVEDYYRSAVQMPKGENGESAQSALVVIDSKTGDVLGVAGAVGKKTANRVQNFATQTLRSPGSSIKPISVYAPALEQGIINWASVYDDVPVSFTENYAKAWPKNANGVYRGLTNVAYAVAHSTNTVAVRVLEELGLRESYRYAKERFHLASLVDGSGVSDCDIAALALGQLNYGLTLREITAAYSVFADGGLYHPWRTYYRVLDANGEILLAAPDAAERVISEENAAIMTKLLQGVVEQGTSSVITLSKSVECAGKTGTTQNDHDRWFIGYTPEWICGVWCGYEYPRPLEGRSLCTGIWNGVMSMLCREIGCTAHFKVPRGLLQLTYCRDSGQLLDEVCLLDPRGERGEVGWFTAENCPQGHCLCHVRCAVDADHGGISHGNCVHEEQISLIRVERHFPMQILVSDSQYVWRGDPGLLPPNPEPHRAYFEQETEGYVGRSAVAEPFNRSCQAHLTQPPEEENVRDHPATLPSFPPGRPPTEDFTDGEEQEPHIHPHPRID